MIHLIVLLLISFMTTGVADTVPPVCSESGTEYYAIDLISTKKVSGTGLGIGKAIMNFVPNPFGIAIAKDGSYQHNLEINLQKVNAPIKGKFVAWVTTSSLDQIKRLGVLDDEFKTNGLVTWNKYLVVITLEDNPKENATIWSGPIAFRGMSKSGFMHTMAGHGPFEQEPCAKIGYD